MAGNLGTMRSVAIVLAAALWVPHPATAQSALDVLNRILGRKTSASSGTANSADATVATPARPGALSLGPQVVRATPGAVGYLDYSLAWRFHPLCRSLHIDKDETRKPLWVKPEEVRPLVSPKDFIKKRRQQRAELESEISRLRTLHRLAQEDLNRYPQSAAAALSKLPSNVSAPARKKAEEDYFNEFAARQTKVQRLSSAINQMASERTESMGRSESLRDFYTNVIKKDLDEALNVELGQRELAIILNVPSQRVAPPMKRIYTKSPRHDDNLNAFNQFFDAPAASAGDRDVVGKYLGRWLDQSWTHRQAFPDELQSLGVVKGGVEITSSIVERVWRKYKVDPVRIQVLREFLSSNQRTFLGDTN